MTFASPLCTQIRSDPCKLFIQKRHSGKFLKNCLKNFSAQMYSVRRHTFYFYDSTVWDKQTDVQTSICTESQIVGRKREGFMTSYGRRVNYGPVYKWIPKTCLSEFFLNNPSLFFLGERFTAPFDNCRARDPRIIIMIVLRENNVCTKEDSTNGMAAKNPLVFVDSPKWH